MQMDVCVIQFHATVITFTLSLASILPKEEEEPQPGTGEKARRQMKTSKSNFKSALTNGISDVTSVRVISEEKEKLRKQVIPKSPFIT